MIKLGGEPCVGKHAMPIHNAPYLIGDDEEPEGDQEARLPW